MGWLPRQRHRSIHDTTPPLPGLRDTFPPRFLRTTGDPCGTLMLPVSPIYRQLPLRTPPLPPPSWRLHQLGDSNRSPHCLLRRRRPPALSSPPTDRTQTTSDPSAFLDDTATDDLPIPSSPAPRRPGSRLHHLSLAHFSSPPRLPSSSVLFFVFVFSPSMKRFYSPTECSIVSG